MKQYGIVHTATMAPVGQVFDDLFTAHQVAESLGEDFSTIAWIGFLGLPAVLAIFRDDGQLETLCTYKAEAENVCRLKNEYPDGHQYKVVSVMLNTAYGPFENGAPG